jgi:glycerol-3-phosphate acyltransferase PlsX
MGSLYAERVLHVPSPRVALLNIGEEPEKGDALTREAYLRLRASDLHFVGNVEPHDLAGHVADVVVCDGFVGNVMVKLTEGLTSYIFRSIREDLLRGIVAPLAVLALRPGIDRLRHRFDYEQFGGSPLLGVRGVSIVTHGRAKARMVENAIRVGSEAAAVDMPAVIADWSRRHPGLLGETPTEVAAEETTAVPVEPAP